VLFTTVTIGSFLVTPTYRATAVLQIERENPNIVTFRDVYSPDNSYMAYSDFYQTQYRLIESRDVMRRVVERLDLPNHPAMQEATRPGPLSRGVSWIRCLLPQPDVEPGLTFDPLQSWIGATKGAVSVQPVKNTHLVEITFVSVDPALAAVAANAVAEEYILFNSELKSRTTGRAGEKLDGEIRNLTGEVEDLDRQIRAFGAENAILDLGNKKSLALSTLEELTRAATQSRIQRARREAAYESLRAADPSSLEAVLTSATIKDLKSRLTDLERQHAEKRELFKPDYPDMIAFRSQIAVVRQQLEAETERIQSQVIGTAETAFRTARGEERRLTALEEEQKERLRKLEMNLAEYENLRSTLDGKKEMRAGLIKRRDETGVLNRMEETQSGNVWLVEAAQPPRGPFRPNKRLNILLSVVMGLGLGVGLAFFFEYLDNSIKNGEDLERTAGIPALGLIPTLKRRGHGKVVALDSSGRAALVEMITHDAPKSHHAEAYRDLRTTLLLSSPDHPPRLLMISSAQPREGKTVTSLNVAVSLTQIGKRVLILDADLRKPRIHKVLGLSREKGLSSWLAGNVPWQGQDLRTSDSFDHVIIDTPPILAVADPLIVAEQVDGVLLVVQGGETPRQSVVAGIEKLRSAKTQILGAVINNLPLVDQDSYAYRYGYRYSYYTHPESEMMPGDDRSGDRAAGGQGGSS